ncbi:dynactin subunit 4 [Naviculisporaceae sp. PSN 640]
MSPITPYTYFQCPCSDSSLFRPGDGSPSSPKNRDFENADRPFDPRAPRANYSLYPLEHLLYCEDCHEIRCPRCIAEEIVTFYCPNCLFEVPSSNIKSEGNRCTRSCFQCPVCIGPLSVTSFETQPDPNLLAAQDPSAAPHGGPYVLNCSYCNWSSNEIGVKFDKSNAIHGQLAKQRNGGTTRLTAKERKERRKELVQSGGTAQAAGHGGDEGGIDVETQFANLKHFYHNQLNDSTSGGNGLSGLGDLGFSSPTSLSRIMSIYTGGSLHDKKSKSRIGSMREALEEDEGLIVADLDESTAVEQLRLEGLAGTIDAEQLQNQPPNLGEPHLHGRTRFTSELRPIPYLLRTKRSKRCPVCRHIISKPEAKIQTTRFRIRLIAGNYVPSITIRPLMLPGSSGFVQHPDQPLQPLRPIQYMLTFKNPIFETVKISLATPSRTPGRFASKVTVLCPQFEIDANTDVWDEALKDDNRRRRKGEESGNPHQQPEVGKIWERGRNWVSIVVEVVPASLRVDLLDAPEDDEEEEGQEEEGEKKPKRKVEVDRSPLREDEDLLEIPMFVRVEWEVDAVGEDLGSTRDKEAKEKRELAYWCVLGLGRVAQG